MMRATCELKKIRSTDLPRYVTVVSKTFKTSFTLYKNFLYKMQDARTKKPENTVHMMQDTHQAIDLNINFKVAGDIRPESEEGYLLSTFNNQDQHTVNHQSIIQSLM